SEPPVGEMRLQWWRDAIVGGEGGGNPLAEALLKTIAENHLPIETFEAMLTARIFDLYNDPMPTTKDLEGYAGETESALFQLAAMILRSGADPGTAEASGHAGVAVVARDALMHFGRDARRRQLFVPRDRLEAAGVDIESVFSGAATPELEQALTELRVAAEDHLGKAKRAIAKLPEGIRTAFLPLSLIKPDLVRIDLSNPFDATKELPRWRRQLAVWRAARRGLV
ncbi:MAG: phytoene/squalene synthase family protein, partial [Alphaproteobacteria bacterium]